ncbi:MAG TPA: hypothetical protein VJZ27_04260, partial [Aggregatilineales bacterium]|nr:hypothetical protein [Aggregatilineales bacterium]
MRKRRILKTLVMFLIAILATNAIVGIVSAQDGDGDEEAAPTEEPVDDAAAEEVVDDAAAETEAVMAEPEPVASNLDTVWLLVTAFLVFWMQAGFALVEAGFVRSKNIVNILMKNLFDFCIGTIVFFVLGFGIMFGSGNDFFGSEWFFLDGVPSLYPGLTVPT